MNPKYILHNTEVTGFSLTRASLYQNNKLFLEKGGDLLPIRLLQCYEVLWVHNIDAIFY